MAEKAPKNINSLDEYLKEGNVAFFGYKGALPDFFATKKKGRARVFIKGRSKNRDEGGDVIRYESLSEVREQQADVYFLDNEATKVLFVDFPPTARYVLIRCLPRVSWIVALPGLIRRIFVELVSVEGVRVFKTRGTSQWWLVVRHQLTQSLNTRLSLSAAVGIQKFLDFLKEQKIKYVVLRFYEKLPNLNRKGGDLDILVSDEDEHKIRAFLQANAGEIGVDVWTPSRSSHNSITYYPPPIANRIIESATPGPAGSLVPAPKEALLSFAYHILYHKGPFAGVPSNIIEVNKHPENDYAGTLKVLAEKIGVDLKINMESIDEYLYQEGWRPKLDTLAKIAPRNKWVWKRFFSTEPAKEVGIGVIIIKQKAVNLGIAKDMIHAVESYPGFKVLREKEFSPEEVQHVAEHLRGGVWNDQSGMVRDFMPAVAIIVLDTEFMRTARLGVARSPGERIRQLKKFLRERFDTEKVSFTHSTDNTQEGWEYIHWCFAEVEDNIKNEVELAYENMHIGWVDRVRLQFSFTPRYIRYRFSQYKKVMSHKIIRWIMDK